MQQPTYSPRRRSRRGTRNRTAEILTISILVALFVLIGLGAMFWMAQNRIAFAPTPTPTATSEPPFTPTVNVPATLVMEDMLTQVAFTAAQATLASQALVNSQTATAVAIAQAGQQPNSPLEQPTSAVFVPNVSSGGDTSPADGGQLDAAQLTATALANPVFVPNVPGPQASDTPVPPTPTNLPGVEPIETATETITTEPTATETATGVPATDTPTFTPTSAFVINNQKGQAVREASMYPGIGTLYTPAGQLTANTTVNIVGRDVTGEWLLVCCSNNISYWTRSFDVRPTDNPTPANAPTAANGNDIRWLPLATPMPGLNPAPTIEPTPLTAADYPQIFRDLRNSSQVPQLPSNFNPPISLAGSQSGGAYISPLVIARNTVYAVSADNNLYAIDKQLGNQRWRYNLGLSVRNTPLVVDSMIYLVTTTGKVVALNDQGSLVWERQLDGTPLTGIKVVDNKLFVGIKGSDTIAYLYMLDRSNQGNQLQKVDCGLTLKDPVIVGHYLFVPGSALYAKDLDHVDGNSIWTIGDLSDPLTAPVYSSPGVRALAELYMVNKEENATRIYVINANTGEILGNPLPGAENAKLLVVSDSYVVTLGSGSLRRFNRSDGAPLSVIGIDNSEPLLASVNGNRLLVVSASGAVTVIDLVNGGQTQIAQRPPTMQSAPALSDLDLYAPGSDSFIWVLRGIQ